jgi:hypothetical protein
MWGSTRLKERRPEVLGQRLVEGVRVDLLHQPIGSLDARVVVHGQGRALLGQA